jgi:hypothetical protein
MTAPVSPRGQHSDQRLVTAALPAPQWLRRGVRLHACLALQPDDAEQIVVEHGGHPARLVWLTATVRPDGTLASDWDWQVMHVADDSCWRGTSTPDGPVPEVWAEIAASGYPHRLRELYADLQQTYPAIVSADARDLTDRDFELLLATLTLAPHERVIADRLVRGWPGDAAELLNTVRTVAADPARRTGRQPGTSCSDTSRPPVETVDPAARS